MNDEKVKNLYRKYLEEVLEVKYKKMVIEIENTQYDSKYYLKVQNDNNQYAYEKFDDLVELDNGNYFGKKDNTFVFFNSDGEEIKRLEGVFIEKFHNGYAKVVSRQKPNLCGYVDMNGVMISDMKWGTGCRDFECGRALVSGVAGYDLGKYGYIDESGELVIPFSSIRCYSFSDDVCCMEQQGRNFYYDKDGNELFADSFTDPFFHDGVVRYKDFNKYGFKNKKGEIVIKAKFDKVSSFNNGLAKTGNGHINLRGDSVKVTNFEDGVDYIKGIIRPTYYNNVKKTYDKMECVPYKDLGEYLICIKDSVYVIFSKESRMYTNTGIKHVSGELSFSRKGNLLELNNNIFYLSSGECISLSNVLNLANIGSYRDEDVLSYEEFSLNIKRDSSYFDRVVNESCEAKKKKAIDDVNRVHAEEDKKRQEIIDKLTSLKAALGKLDKGASDLSQIDRDVLIREVDDHFEINPEFLNQLRFLNLAYIDFTNVKVSGIDFSGSNASIDPQLVYKKDMSNGKYDGLSFTTSDFSGVNITGASFDGCNMDFALMDGAIREERYGK